MVISGFEECVEEFKNPKHFFDSDERATEVARLFRKQCRIGFFEVYRDLGCRAKYLYLLSVSDIYPNFYTGESQIIYGAMGISRAELSGIPCLVLEGIAASPKEIGPAFFKAVRLAKFSEERVICGSLKYPLAKTAIESCSIVQEAEKDKPAVREIRKELADYLKEQESMLLVGIR
jgi:hypothetical protein